MAILTIRLSYAHRDWWAAKAKRRGVCLNKLREELSVRALTEHDTAVPDAGGGAMQRAG